MSKYGDLQIFCKLQKPLANQLAAFARRRGRGFESPRLHSGNHYRLAVSPFRALPDWWWQFKKKQAFGVRLCGFESGYADKHRASECGEELLWLFASTKKP
jgi:hypothetical protein